MGLLHEALPASALVVAIGPGKGSNWVWLSTGEAGAVVPPQSLPDHLRPQMYRLQSAARAPAVAAANWHQLAEADLWVMSLAGRVGRRASWWAA